MDINVKIEVIEMEYEIERINNRWTVSKIGWDPTRPWLSETIASFLHKETAQQYVDAKIAGVEWTNPEYDEEYGNLPDPRDLDHKFDGESFNVI